MMTAKEIAIKLMTTERLMLWQINVGATETFLRVACGPIVYGRTISSLARKGLITSTRPAELTPLGHDVLKEINDEANVTVRG